VRGLFIENAALNIRAILSLEMTHVTSIDQPLGGLPQRSRDDFPAPIKEMLAKRVRHECSNPNCRQPTSGPQEDALKAINLGVAAHICAAASNGPRYDTAMTPEQRSSIDNGIWLCQNCAKLVDNDEARYPVNFIRSWKVLAEKRAARALKNTRSPDRQRNERFDRIEQLMPELLLEMREDMTKNPLCREFILLPKGVSFWYPNDRTMFTYYNHDHPDIGSKLRILANYGLISDIRHNDVPRYAFREEFVEYLIGQ
jgi:hypothetical protein